MIRAFFLFLAVALVLGCSGPKPYEVKAAVQEAPPNIVLIVTDDMMQDDLWVMPKTRSLLVDGGVKLKNAFVTDSVCCPSRATILTGRYAHNTRVITNKAPHHNDAFKDDEDSTVATWLDATGYRTGFFGVYLKGHYGEYVPPGWDEGLFWTMGGSEHLDAGSGGMESVPEDEHKDDWTAAHVAEFLGSGESPKFAVWAPHAPHDPAIPPERYEGNFAERKAPRPPSFNEADVSDKPSWNAEKPRLSPARIDEIDALYRNRLRTLKAVDDGVEKIANALQARGELENTYFVLTSDNGMHLGVHRLTPMKQSAYEEDIRVPMVVRGPGIPQGETRGRFALNNDLAPTIAEWAGVEAPAADGRSLAPLLRGEPGLAWRTSFMVEKWGEQLMPYGYKGVRTRNWLFVRYSNGERELYNVLKDPYQLENLAGQRPWVEEKLSRRIDALKDCTGDGCREAENL